MFGLMKFFEMSSDSNNVADFKMYSHPWLFKSFSEIFKCLMVLLLFMAVPMISPPVLPMSLSYNRRVSKHLFWRMMAAIHLAPSTPSEFLRIEPSRTPKSRHFSPGLLANSSKTISSPESLIIFEARLRLLILGFVMIDLIACMP
jgi:hypothetical protein